MSEHCGKTPSPKLFDEMKESFYEVTEQGLQEIIQHWETIYGTSSEAVVDELITELKKHFKDFWKQQSAKLSEIKEEYLQKIDIAGKEAVILEKALGLEPQVTKVPNHGTLVQMEEQLLSLLESYQDMKNERLEIYFHLQKKEQELTSVLDMKTPKYKLEAPHDENEDGIIPVGQSYVPTSDDIAKFNERVRELEQLKEQLEYDFEEAKSQLRQLLEECCIVPLTKEERCAFDEAELPVTKRNLTLLMDSGNKYRRKKEEMMAEAAHLRDQIEQLSKKMFKDANELEQFLSDYSGFTEPTIDKLKEKLKELKEERKHNLKELIANSRKALEGWWNKCCYTDAQRKEFTPYNATRRTEEVLEIHELEIENLEHFYNRHKKIFTLAEQHEELWQRLLHLEEQANNKDRLFNNRGGCLLKEEKERKVIQKRVPAIKSQLMALLDNYKEETGKDFMYYGEPLRQTIEIKEHLREISKNQERLQRKTANAENVMWESRLGARPITGGKRKAVMTPQDTNRIKLMRTETLSTASSKSTLSSKSASSASGGTLVRREMEKNPVQGQSHLTVPVNYVMHTPSTNRIPAASTPQNGSLSYESFQEHIEKSKYLAHNSTRKIEQQRVLRPKNLNQTRTVEKTTTTPYRTPKTPSKTFTKTPMKTPGKTFTKTPTKTPSRIPFRIPTGSKIPSQVPPVSPRKPVLSTTKLPIIF